MSVITSPRLDVNFTDPAVNQDPFPVYERIRELGPVVYNGVHDVWMVPGYRESRAVLTRHETFQQDAEMLVFGFGGRTVATLAPPLHSRLRAVFTAAFQRHALEADGIEDTVAATVAEKLDPAIDAVLAGGEVDLKTLSIEPMVTAVILRMLDIDLPGMPEKFREWASAITLSNNELLRGDVSAMVRAAQSGELSNPRLDDGARARIELQEFGREVLADRAARPDARDVLRELAVSGLDGGDGATFDPAEMLSDDDMRAQVTLLVVAAQNNTVNVIAGALGYLARDPGLRARLVADHDLIPPFIEEVLRHHGSIQVSPRIVAPGGAELGGVVIPEGARVWVLNGAANRDPERWDDPHRFDVDRPMKASLGFGMGIHNCMGSNLARMEARYSLDHLLTRLPDFEIDDIDYGDRHMSRGPVELVVRRASDG